MPCDASGDRVLLRRRIARDGTIPRSTELDISQENSIKCVRKFIQPSFEQITLGFWNGGDFTAARLAVAFKLQCAR